MLALTCGGCGTGLDGSKYASSKASLGDFAGTFSNHADDGGGCLWSFLDEERPQDACTSVRDVRLAVNGKGVITAELMEQGHAVGERESAAVFVGTMVSRGSISTIGRLSVRPTALCGSGETVQAYFGLIPIGIC